MASKRVLLVFVLPAVFSVVFGSLVMADILQKPDRQLNMWPTPHEAGTSSSLKVIGLLKEYSVSDSVGIQVVISDPRFSCGYLYVTLYLEDEEEGTGGGEVVTQNAYSQQCFGGESATLPIDDEFLVVVDTAGSYRVVAEMVSPQLKGTSVAETFTVK